MERLGSIQALRALAALMVTVAHTHNLTNTLGLPTFAEGAFGVDLFFVISGFVMMYSAEPLFGQPGGALTFIKRRLIRIVPLYWIVTSLSLLSWWILWWRFKTSPPEYTTSNIIASFFFIPSARPNQDWGPVVSQGWTLNYEMFFYAIFTVFVILPRKMAAAGVILALLAFYAIGAPMPLGYFATPLLMLFVVGIVLGLFHRQIRLSRETGLACLLAGFVIAYLVSDDLRGPGRWPYSVAAAGLIVLGALQIEGRSWWWVVLLGDASYALYLTHGLAMQQFYFTLRWLGTQLEPFPWLYTAALLAASIAVALVFHLIIEKPTTEWLKRVLTRRRA